MHSTLRLHLTLLLLIGLTTAGSIAGELERVKFNNPGLVVDLGAGLWAFPVPVDVDDDGDPDLIVVCPDRPYNGTYLFENPGGTKEKSPVFKAPRRIGKGMTNVSPSYLDGKLHVLSPNREHPQFLKSGVDEGTSLGLAANIHPNKVRHNQWKYVDFDGDGRRDLIVGVEDWTEYGWDDAFDESGKWTNGPLHGYVYWLRNTSDDAPPKYSPPQKVEAAGKPIDTFGLPSPNFADFDGDGDLDLLCGEFLDGFTYFQNVGTRQKPRYAQGQKLTHAGKPLAMDLEMIVPVAFDWDSDGDQDLIVGDEDGRVALVEHTGQIQNGLPQFLPPKYFQQEADDVKFGALATPCGFDWDGDGDQDILCGNTAGHIGWIENLSGPGVEQPRLAAPQLLTAGDNIIRIQAGPNGSIQGPCEAKWGYTVQTAGDWDLDGLPDIVANSIWGTVIWYRNVGTRERPKLAAGEPLKVNWTGKPPKPAWNWWNPQDNEFVTQWRTTPLVVDWNRDRLPDLVMLDHEGYLAFFQRTREGDDLILQPGQRIFCDEAGNPLHWNSGRAGKSGRRKLCVTDWDGDGALDFLADSTNANWFRQVAARDGKFFFRDMGPLFQRDTSGHSPSSTVVDWNGDGRPELLLGGEDGHLYHGRPD